MSLIKRFNSGLKYMAICPTDKNLSYSFPEIKLINYIRWANKCLPPAIIALFVCQYFFRTDLVLTILTALFALSLPIQGIFWLGTRANNPIPLTLLSWYNTKKRQLIEKQIIAANPPKKTELNFMSFMEMLNLARQHLDEDEYDLNDEKK